MGRNRAYPGPDDDVGDEHEERWPDCTYTASLMADGWTLAEAQEIAADAEAKSARRPRQTEPDTTPIPFSADDPDGALNSRRIRRHLEAIAEEALRLAIETVTEEALRPVDGEP